MAHWRKPHYKQAPSLGRPDMLAHTQAFKEGRAARLSNDLPPGMRIALGLICWAIVIGAMWVAHRVL